MNQPRCHLHPLSHNFLGASRLTSQGIQQRIPSSFKSDIMEKFDLSFTAIQQIVPGECAKQKDLLFLLLAADLKESRNMQGSHVSKPFWLGGCSELCSRAQAIQAACRHHSWQQYLTRETLQESLPGTSALVEHQLCSNGISCESPKLFENPPFPAVLKKSHSKQPRTSQATQFPIQLLAQLGNGAVTSWIFSPQSCGAPVPLTSLIFSEGN